MKSSLVHAVVGDIEILAVKDFEEPQTMHDYFPSASEEKIAEYRRIMPGFFTGDTIDDFGYWCYVIKAHGTTILFDTGVGNSEFTGRRYAPQWKGKLLSRLEEAGIRLEEIDVVILSHLHCDHIGWTTLPSVRGYARAFPQARYKLPLLDWDAYAQGVITTDATPEECYISCIEPLEQEECLDLVGEGSTAICEGVKLLIAPGHTPGSCCLIIESCGERCVLTGDCFASPLQVSYPDCSFLFDMDPEKAEESRKMILGKCASDALLGSCHFGIGEVQNGSQGRPLWRPL